MNADSRPAARNLFAVGHKVDNLDTGPLCILLNHSTIDQGGIMNPIVTVTGFWDAFVTKIAVFLPNLFFSIAILLLGWVLCNVIKRVIVRLLKLCQFDNLAERAGIKQILEKGGIKQSTSDIIGLLAFWFLFLIAIVTT